MKADAGACRTGAKTQAKSGQSVTQYEEEKPMKKTYEIEVDCANCANLMEEATKKTEGVADATVNFMTQKMTVEFEEGAEEKKVMKSVFKACRKVEPDCEIDF